MAKVKSIYMDRLEAAADRGAADAYYGRDPAPNMWINFAPRTGIPTVVSREAMSKDEIEAYWEGHDNEQDRKDWC